MSSIFVVSDLHIKEEMIAVFKDKNCQITKQYLEEHINKDTDLLVICGDLLDKGGDANPAKAVELATEIMKVLCSFGCKVIFIPGNHDISDNLLTLGEGKYSRINGIMKNVSKNYPNLVSPQISSTNTIVSTYVIENALIIAINSTCSIGLNHESGSINEVTLNKELLDLKNNTSGFENYNKIVIMHHNCCPYGANDEELENYNRDSYNGNLQNAARIKQLLDKFGIVTYITGHEHGSQSLAEKNLIDESQHSYYTVDSLGVANECSSVTMSQFEITETGTIDKQTIHAFVQLDGVGVSSFWHPVCPQKVGPFDASYEDIPPTFESEKKPINWLDDADDYLKGRIREFKLLKTGHFCYNGACGLTWVDTSPFIADHHRLNKICRFFCLAYPVELEDANVFIGFGMKGTLIANGIRAFYLNKRVVFYPDNNDSSYDKNAFFAKELATAKNIAVFTDVYCSGETIKNFLSGLDTKKKDVSVFCIFDRRDKNANQTRGYTIHSLCQIPRIQCSFKTKEDCPIYTNRLCEITY